jgi:hypothetical protein
MKIYFIDITINTSLGSLSFRVMTDIPVKNNMNTTTLLLAWIKNLTTVAKYGLVVMGVLV